MGIVTMGDIMKKFFFILNLSMVLLCYGCRFNVTNYNDNNFIKDDVPTTVINNTNTNNIESDLTKLYSNTVKSVVTVLNYASYYDRGGTVTSLYGSGSGFVYAYDEDYIYLYTNAHVVSVSRGYNQSYYEVVFFDGGRLYGDLIYKDDSEDVAVMKVSRGIQDFAVVSIGNSDFISPGEDVFAIGSPLGLEYSNTITKGVISNFKVAVDTDDDQNGEVTTMYLIQIDAALNPGNSGGPLFNMKGEVVGVNTLKIMSNDSGDDVESFNFSIPINHFVFVANCLIEDGKYSRPLIGIEVIDIKSISLGDREKLGIELYKGVYIESVVVSGTANGILSKGMIIIKINDIDVGDMADFAIQLYKHKSGDRISVTTSGKNGGNVMEHNLILK